MSQNPTVLDRVFDCARIAIEKRGSNVVILDVSTHTSFTDYFLVVSASSDRRVRTIAEAIRAQMKEADILPIGVEGLKEGKWALLDFGSWVVHIFYEDLRMVFDLEGLWADAKEVELPKSVVEAANAASAANAAREI